MQKMYQRMNKPAYKVYKIIPMIIVMGIIFILSHQRGDEIELPGFAHSDLVAHMIAYAVLGGAVLYAWSERFKRAHPVKVILYTVAFCLAYGISDEFHQSFIPGRYVSGMDILADTIGAILVTTGWWFYSQKSVASKIFS